MTNYEKHEMEITLFSTEDVVLTSDFVSGDGNTGGAEWEDE